MQTICYLERAKHVHSIHKDRLKTLRVNAFVQKGIIWTQAAHSVQRGRTWCIRTQRGHAHAMVCFKKFRVRVVCVRMGILTKQEIASNVQPQ
jgi:hypothetical protein